MKNFGDWLELAGFILTVAIAFGGVVWRIASIDKRSAQADAELRAHVTEVMAKFSRDYDETFRGLRQQINDGRLDATAARLETERLFVSKITFGAVIAELAADIKGLGERIENRLTRMEDKLDRASEERGH